MTELYNIQATPHEGPINGDRRDSYEDECDIEQGIRTPAMIEHGDHPTLEHVLPVAQQAIALSWKEHNAQKRKIDEDWRYQ